MASHFRAVGFPAGQIDEVQDLLARAGERAQETVEHEDGRTLHYEDPAGATLAIHLGGDGDFECCQPGFAGASRLRWRPLQVVRDAKGCRFCDLVYAELLDEDDEMVYPFALTIETMGATRSLIPYGDPGEVSSHVIAYGIVVSVEERRTKLDDAPFRVVRLDTRGGVLDTCPAPGTFE